MVFFKITGGLLGLLMETLYWCKASFKNSEKVFAQLYIIGNQTFP